MNELMRELIIYTYIKKEEDGILSLCRYSHNGLHVGLQKRAPGAILWTKIMGELVVPHPQQQSPKK